MIESKTPNIEKQTYQQYKKERDKETAVGKSLTERLKKNLKQGKKSKKEFKKFLKKKVQSRQVIKDSRGIVRMRSPEDEQTAPFKHTNVYFKNQYEQERNNLFMS